jgi:hypothetical protein
MFAFGLSSALKANVLLYHFTQEMLSTRIVVQLFAATGACQPFKVAQSNASVLVTSRCNANGSIT